MNMLQALLDQITAWMHSSKQREFINQRSRRLRIEILEKKQVMAASEVGLLMPTELMAMDSLLAQDQFVTATAESPIAFEIGILPNSQAIRNRHNDINRFDVNRDGLVTPIDVLFTINLLNRSRAFLSTSQIDAQVDGYFDVNNDLLVTPLDILQVINFMHVASRSGPSVEMKPLTYAVGNSLTGDLVFVLEGRGFDRLTKDANPPTVTGVHLNCSRNLDRIWNNPEETCGFVESFGMYRQALAQPVDNVILQPFYGSTIAEEIQAIKNLIDYTRMNPENIDTRFFIYATWGVAVDSESRLPFYDTWITHEATLDGPFVPSQSTYAMIQAELIRSGYDAPLIPVGHTFVAMIDAIRNGTKIELLVNENNEGQLRGMVEAEFWRDPIHASLTGKYVAGLSAYATLYSTPPVGIDPVAYTWYYTRIGATLPSIDGMKTIEHIVWNTHLLQKYQ